MAEPGHKDALRARVSLLPVDARSASDLLALGRLAQMHLLAGFPPETGWKVALYAAMTGEVETRLIAEAVRQAGGEVYYPLIRPEGVMSFHRVAIEDELAPGPYGIPAPPAESGGLREQERFDLVVVPGLAFDLKGFRLGRGGGYYDRFLSRILSRNVVGLAFSWQIVPAVPVDPWDVPVGAIVTEKGVIRVSPGSGGHRV